MKKEWLKKKVSQFFKMWKHGFLDRRIVILCYHSVHPSKKFSSATPQLFEEHLKWIKEHCSVVSLFEVPFLTAKGEQRKPIVAITFDDGYADNYEYAFPLLQKYGIPATFFVTVGLLEKDPKVIERFQVLRRASLEDIAPLTWSQVREMRKAGMEIGSHTWSHPNLAWLKLVEARQELVHSKEVLEERLGEKVSLLAYPFGKPGRHFTLDTLELTRETGYEVAVAVLFRSVKPDDSPLALPRFFVTRDNVTVLAEKIMGAWDWLGWWQEKAPLWLARLISPEDFQA